MTRENKLALIIGFSLLLVVAVLLADHLSPAQQDRLAMLDTPAGDGPTINLPAGQGAHRQFGAAEDEQPQRPDRRTILIDPPTIAMSADVPGGNEGGGDDAIRRISQFEGGGLVAPDFGRQMNREGEQPETIQMGAPPLPAPDQHARPVDRGDATPYTVRARDTLYGLCKTFYSDGSLYEKLARFNADIVPANGRIRTGMTLWIPSRAALDGRVEASPPRQATQSPAERADANAKTINHTIKENDRLWDLAAHYLGKGHRYKEILALNRDVITNENVLPIGKTIRIPSR